VRHVARGQDWQLSRAIGDYFPIRRLSREFVPCEVFENRMTKTNTFMSCFRVFGVFCGSSKLKRDNDGKTTLQGVSKSA